MTFRSHYNHTPTIRLFGQKATTKKMPGMTHYLVTGAKASGKTVKIKIAAESEAEAATLSRKQGVYPIAIRRWKPTPALPKVPSYDEVVERRRLECDCND